MAALVAFLLSPTSPVGANLWTPSPDVTPTGAQLALFVAVTIIEAIAFGLGIAFLAFGWPAIRRIFAASAGWTRAVYGSLGWLLVSPWIHDSIHIVTGHGLDAIIVLNYVFHFGVAPVVAVLLLALFRVSRAMR